MHNYDFSTLTFLYNVLWSLVFVFILWGCTPTEEISPEHRKLIQDSIIHVDSLHRIDSVRAYKIKSANEQFPIIHYRKAVLNSKLLDSVRHAYGKKEETMDGYRAFTLLNRKDIHYYRFGDTVIIPDTIIKDLRAYSLFPHYYTAAENIHKFVFVSNKYQCYACYDSGRLVRFAACNSGEERKPTFPGRYAIYWKSRLRHSSLDSTWILPFTCNIHLQAGSAFHQFDMPGRPVSHSCIRQFMPDAEWLFKWGRGAKLDSNRRFIPLSGTPVIILDLFDFTRRRGGPWRELTSNKEPLIPLPDDPMSVEEALIPISQIPVDSRGSLVNPNRYKTAEDTLRERGVIRPNITLRETINYNKLRKEKARAKARALKQKKEEKSADKPVEIPLQSSDTK
ncbi:MAG: L,D-transpeptidase [Ignavibacteria bacterium]|nr:L,D-transpeptidase [Ignavibacteria bacterium]